MPILNAFVIAFSSMLIVYLLHPRRIEQTTSASVAASSPAYLWLSALAFYTYFSAQPDGYAIRNQITPTPIRDLGVVLLFSSIECLLLHAVIKFGPRRVAHKVLALMCLFWPWAALCIAGSMNSSPVFTAHAVWQLLVAIGLLVSLILCARRRHSVQ